MFVHLVSVSGFIAALSSCYLVSAKNDQSCPPLSSIPPSLREFSSTFQQPNPPHVNNEFTASWIQHKWYVRSIVEGGRVSNAVRNVNLSHISAGVLYNSPTANKVRADESYDMNIASSLFDYNNLSSDGLVSNTVYDFTPSILSKPIIFNGYVDSNYPLFTQDILQSNSGVFTGVVDRPMNGKVYSVSLIENGSDTLSPLTNLNPKWSILYQNAIPVTVFVDTCNTVVGYDYFSPGLRTRVVTEFFNIAVGPVPAKIFEFSA